MTKPAYIIIQHDPSGAPGPRGDRLGSLLPVNMDGVYFDLTDAEAVAAFMASERPNLTTTIAAVVRVLP